MARKKSKKNSEVDESGVDEYNPFEDPIYSKGVQELIAKSMKKGVNITNTLDGDVEVTETRIYRTVYSWDREKRKIVIKSKGFVSCKFYYKFYIMLSLGHLIVILLILLLLFGAGKLPSVMADLARGIKSFKKNLDSDSESSSDGLIAPSATKEVREVEEVKEVKGVDKISEVREVSGEEYGKKPSNEIISKIGGKVVKKPDISKPDTKSDISKPDTKSDISKSNAKSDKIIVKKPDKTNRIKIANKKTAGSRSKKSSAKLSSISDKK